MVLNRLTELLRCPICGAGIGLDDVATRGSAACSNGHQFEVRDGYIDLSGSESPDGATRRTFESFGYEWNTFDDVRDEDAQFADVYFRDLDLASLAGKIGLDAGCGKGRYTRFVAPSLGALVALDGSSAVAAAARNLRSHPNVLVVKADLRTVPIARSSIDFVMCLGVLHHLEDPRSGFDKLAELLAPGGQMLLYLYSRPSGLGVRRAALYLARQLRRLTTKLPHRVLRLVSKPVAAVLYVGVVQVGAFGDRMKLQALSRLPMSSYRGKPFRSLDLDTFDRLSAPVEHRYVWDELARWFTEAHMTVDAVRDEAGWFVLAHKPSRVDPRPTAARARSGVTGTAGPSRLL